MALLTKLYTFIAGATAQPNEVNVNFDDVIDFVNNDLVHLDGSKTATAHLSGPSTDPTANDQYTRKAYVDALTSLRLRPRAGGSWNVASGGTVDPTAVQLQFIAGTAVATTNVNGAATITFPAAFPTACISVIVSNGDTDTNASVVGTTTVTQGSFDVSVEPNPGAGAGFRVNYIAVGY